MSWMRWTGAAAGLLLLSGCVYGYQMVRAEARYGAAGRPEPSYYCYDCHGYRYFDPYYDWCATLGFRYTWARHPQVITLYRQRYVRIREQHPDYGRYRYPAGYRNSDRYRAPRDYEAWRGERGRRGERGLQEAPARGARPGERPERTRTKDGPREKEKKHKGKDDDHERRDRTKPRERGLPAPASGGVES